MTKINIKKDIHRINLSAYYWLLNKEEEALRYLNEVRISRFTLPIVRYCYYMNLAEYKYYDGKKEEARKILDENIKKESNKNLLEIFLDYEDNPEQKVFELEKILPKQRNRLYKMQVENALAIAYEEIGNFEKALKQAGAKVIIGDIDKEKGEMTANELDGDFYYLDVINKEQVQYVVQSICEKYGKLSILCSNTGIFPQVTIEDMTEEDWDKVQNINVKGAFLVIQATLKHMKKQNYGRIVLISSITGDITGYPGWAHYGASKAAQLGFMRTAALEYAKYGITINAIQPGNILTDGLIEAGEEYMNKMKSVIPVNVLGKPEDIGYTAVFLASREAGFITGQRIVVDGGQILPETPDFQ